MSLSRCIVCARSLALTEQQTCLACLGAARRSLRAIAGLIQLAPLMIGQLGAVVIDFASQSAENDLPGGDLLAMLGPGAEHGDGAASDPPAVAFELMQWCDDWAQMRGERSPGTAVAVSASWLSTRAGWAAAHHPAFDEFVRDLARLLRSLEIATGTNDDPMTGAPCFACGANLERAWTDRGLADDWVCPRCARVYPPAHYALAMRAQLDEQAPQAEGYLP